jgi:hypothetical protein
METGHASSGLVPSAQASPFSSQHPVRVSRTGCWSFTACISSTSSGRGVYTVDMPEDPESQGHQLDVYEVLALVNAAQDPESSEAKDLGCTKQASLRSVDSKGDSLTSVEESAREAAPGPTQRPPSTHRTEEKVRQLVREQLGR